MPAIIASVVIGLHATVASASETGDNAPRASVSLARHATTNALDGPLLRGDRYTVLRGSLEDTLAHDLGSTRFALEFDARRFDAYRIEDDVVVAAVAETTGRVSERFELRGTLSARLSDEGDDLTLGRAVLGTRIGMALLTASTQAGIRLAPDTTLVVEGAVSREIAGKTRFERHLIAPLRLEPDRTRLELASTLTRMRGPYAYGANAAARWRRAAAAGVLRQITIAEYTARLLGTVTFGEGGTLGAAAGMQMLRLTDGIFRQVRPTYEMTAALPLSAVLSLSGSLKGAYDIASRDDPVASWVRNGQAGASFRASPVLRFGTGVFAERRTNLALGNMTTARGVYGLAAWLPQEKLELIFRLDFTRKTQTAPHLKWRAVDAQVAITRKL